MGRVSPAMKEIYRISPVDAVRVLTEPQFWTPSCFTAYLKRCADLVRLSPSDGLELAKLAPGYADRLRVNASKRRDAKIRGLAELAAAYRARGDLQKSTACIDKAAKIDGTPLAQAHLSLRWADLLIEKKDDRALFIINQTISLFSIHAPRSEEHAAAIIVRGIAYRILEGDVVRAQREYLNALSMLHPRKHERVYCAAVHNLGCAILLGSTELEPMLGALKLAERELSRLRVRRLSIPHAKLRWVRALAFARLGSTQLAKDLLQSSRRDLLSLGAYRDFVRISLDLCRLHLFDGKREQIRLLTNELFGLPVSLEEEAVILLWQRRADDGSFSEDTVAWLYRKLYGIKFPVASPREISGV